MKLIKFLLLIPLTIVFIFLSVTPFTGCEKTVTIHDTTVITKHDTTIKRDTTVVKDTLYDITSGLVAWYNFNGGTLKDSSGFNNHIVFNNATATTDRFGRTGNAYLFNGTSSYMQVNNSNSLNPNSITMFAIVKVNGFYAGPCHGNQLFSKGYTDNVNGYFAMRFNNLNACDPIADSAHEYFGAAFGDNYPFGAAAQAGADTVYINKGVWYTVTYTYDGLTSRFYVNGTLKKEIQKAVPFTATSSNFMIGRQENPSYPYWLNGVLDEIRIYNRALPQPAITLLNKLNN